VHLNPGAFVCSVVLRQVTIASLNSRGYWKNRPSQQLFKEFIYIYFPALAGHLQVEYRIILGKLPHYNGSVVLCYRSYFVYSLANAAIVYLICEIVKTLKFSGLRFGKCYRRLSNM
jgi:hypothetical protein